MLKLITRDNSVIPIKCDDYYIKQLAAGYDELLFSVSIYDPVYPQIQEECRVLADEGQYYLVKAIDGGGDTASIKCVLDVDDWRSPVYLSFKTAENVSVASRPRIGGTISNSGMWSSSASGCCVAVPLTAGKRYKLTWRQADKKIVGDVFRAGQCDRNDPGGGQQLASVIVSSPEATPTVDFVAGRSYYIIEVDAAKANAALTSIKLTMLGNDTPAEIINKIIPTGWSMTDSAGITEKVIVEMAGVTPLDVLEACRGAFDGLTYRFDNRAKTITLLDMYGGDNVGAFVTRDLNLKKNDYKGKSTGFATRLYATGKDGLTFSDINGGLPYIDDNTYSDKVVCAYWQDESVETAARLLIMARERLTALAAPSRSYTCDVVDLAAADPAKYSFLSFPLFSVCALIDSTRAMTKVNHIVMERWIYPNLPAKNKVVLSTVAPRIQTQVAAISKSLADPNSAYQQQQRATFEVLASIFTGAHGGSVRLLDTDGDGEPDELYIADSTDPSTAGRVWRFNYLGWAASTNGYEGPFTLGASFENGGTIYANALRVNGAYTVQRDDGTVAGYLGRGKGNDGVSDTWGVALCGPGSNPDDMTSATNYVIVTGSGARMQAGNHEVYVTANGAYYDDHEIITEDWVTNIYAPEIQAIWDAIASIPSN